MLSFAGPYSLCRAGAHSLGSGFGLAWLGLEFTRTLVWVGFGFDSRFGLGLVSAGVRLELA